ncbi:MAG TPA: hypothetical protein VK576_03355 [Thermoleophilia bacterium]|nr:hypothetical protein [Thermoleophilia bacterium]
MPDDIQQELAEIEALFVQTAQSMSAANDTITLHGLTPHTIFFSDRPQRVVGHLTSRQFVDEWDQGENSFAEDPPNAVISFLQSGDQTPEDAVLVIKDPRLDEDELTYGVEVLEGSLPTSAALCTMFIDPFGRPLSPMSVAGVRRRQRRRGF